MDMYAKRMGYIIDDMDSAKKLTMMMIDGERIGFFSEVYRTISYNNLIFIHNLSGISNFENEVGFICVTSLKDVCCNVPNLHFKTEKSKYRYRMQEGIKAEDIISAVLTILSENNLLKIH